jgi:hypothetical protein
MVEQRGERVRLSLCAASRTPRRPLNSLVRRWVRGGVACPPCPPLVLAHPCSDTSQVSGRRWRAEALATIRRSNCTCSFPAYSFHEDAVLPSCNGRN